MADFIEIWNKMQYLLKDLTSEQTETVKSAMCIALNDYRIEERTECEELTVNDNSLRGYQMFFVSKQVEGLSPKSLIYYKSIVDLFLSTIQKPLELYTSDDIRLYLAKAQLERKCSFVTIDNERRVLSNFFAWLADEGYVQKNICHSIKKIKTPKKQKKAFSDIEIMKIKDACNGIGIGCESRDVPRQKRDIALVEFLLSTGCRVGEVAALRKSDIDLENRTALVTGKGNKQRTVYISPVAKARLLDYWNEIKPSEWCFPSFQSSKKPLTESGIEREIGRIGRAAGVSNCHPHRFRRTCATMAIKKGMTLIDVQRMLGHENAETTRIYLDLDDTNLKHQHEKFFT